jgi:hypothetical protein
VELFESVRQETFAGFDVRLLLKSARYLDVHLRAVEHDGAVAPIVFDFQLTPRS